MNKYLSYLRNVLFLSGLSFALNIISWLIIYAQIKPTSEVIPLHYNIFYGSDLSGPGYFLYMLPLIGLTVMVINSLFYHYAKSQQEFAGKTLIVVSLVLQILIMISVISIKSIIII